MFDFVLNAAKQVGDTIPNTLIENFSLGTEVTLLGMGTVFSVLIIIWMMVELLHLILGDKTKKVKSKPAPTVTDASTAVNAITDEIEEAPLPTAPDYEIIAVITAAVAAASGASPNSFRVVSFKRANSKFSSGK